MIRWSHEQIGIYGGDMGVIFRTGGIMFIIAILGLISGIGGAYFGANASAHIGADRWGL